MACSHGGARRNSGRKSWREKTASSKGQTTLTGILAGRIPRQTTNSQSEASGPTPMSQEAGGREINNQNSSNDRERVAQELRNLRELQQLADEVEANEQECIGMYLEDSDQDTESNDEAFDIDIDSTQEDDDFLYVGSKNSREKGKYISDPLSPVGKYLKLMRLRMGPDGDLRSEIQSGRQYFPPQFDPVARDGCKGSNWYGAGKCSIFVFLPYLQYAKLCDVKETPCIHCKNTGCLESKGLFFRPMHNFSEISYLFHRRLSCRECSKTMSEIDPRFLSNLPTRVVERLPFLTTVRGPGIHQMMLEHFKELIVKGVGFVTYTKSINSLKRTQHAMDHVSYLDSWHDAVSEGTVLSPISFSAYGRTGYYSGLDLTASLLKHLFIRQMSGLENYLQAACQLLHDEGVSHDHTHKFANKINSVGNVAGKLFTGSYTVMSLSGFVLASRLTFTKSNDEIKPMVEKIKEIRSETNAGPLKIRQADGGGDGSLWDTVFHSELNNGMTRYRPTSVHDKPIASIRRNRIQVLTTLAEASSWSTVVLDAIIKVKSPVIPVGFDMEWRRGDPSTVSRFLQIAWPDNIEGLEGTEAIAFDLQEMGLATSGSKLPKKVCELFEHQKIKLCGVNVDGDLKRLRNLGVNYKNVACDLGQFASSVDCSASNLIDTSLLKGYGLEDLCPVFLQIAVDKRNQKADFGLRPLTPDMIEYAALDAKLHLKLYVTLAKLPKKSGSSKAVLGGTVRGLKEGTVVDLYFHNKIAAKGIVEFTGSHGDRRQWGSFTVGKNHSLIRLTKVLQRNVLPVASWRPTREQRDDNSLPPPWEKSQFTVGDVFEKYPKHAIPWPNCRMKVSVDVPISQVESLEQTPASLVQSLSTNTLNVEVEVCDDNVVNENVQSLAPRSRSKLDMWHILDDIPMSKDDISRTLVTRLLIHATFRFNTEDFEAVATHLSENEGISSEIDLLDHFYHNREWWRKRVRTYVLEAKKHAAAVMELKDRFLAHPCFKDYYSDKLDCWLNGFILKIEAGSFEDLEDVSLFAADGIDGHGLRLWIRRRGSTRAENYHHKLKEAYGAWSYGAQVAHYLLLLVTYKYNVSTGIARCGWPSFGHTNLHYVDRIQVRIQQLFGANPYINHKNVTLAKPVADFTAVGIGPLWGATDDFVMRGKPDPTLTGNAKFVAEKLGVTSPPRPLAHVDEFKIYSDYLRKKPGNMTNAKWYELAKEFERRANNKTIFPKLPSMLKAHYTRWKVNCSIRQLQDAVKEKYNSLLLDLGRPIQKSQDSDEAVSEPDFGSCNDDESSDLCIAVDENPLAVPPSVAPKQHTYLRPHAVAPRKCFWSPFCDKFASECGGIRSNLCVRKLQGLVHVPMNEAEFRAQKVKQSNEQRRLKRAIEYEESKAKKRAAREQTTGNTI